MSWLGDKCGGCHLLYPKCHNVMTDHLHSVSSCVYQMSWHGNTWYSWVCQSGIRTWWCDTWHGRLCMADMMIWWHMTWWWSVHATCHDIITHDMGECLCQMLWYGHIWHGEVCKKGRHHDLVTVDTEELYLWGSPCWWDFCVCDLFLIQP